MEYSEFLGQFQQTESKVHCVEMPTLKMYVLDISL